MVSALDSGSSGSNSSHARILCALSFNKIVFWRNASLHLGLQVSTREVNAGGKAAMYNIPSRDHLQKLLQILSRCVT